MTPNEKAAKLIKGRTTAQLIEDFILTGGIRNENVYTVRGWIMEELEARNPEAYAAWLEGDAEDESLREYFNT